MDAFEAEKLAEPLGYGAKLVIFTARPRVFTHPSLKPVLNEGFLRRLTTQLSGRPTKHQGGATGARRRLSLLLVMVGAGHGLGAQRGTATPQSHEQQFKGVEKVAPEASSAGAIWVNPKDELRYLWIPPGTFTMGCSAGDGECFDDEKPAHRVAIRKGFWIAKTLVTQSAYERVTSSNPSHFKGGQMPVEMVSWSDAQGYCHAIEMRLPTEAEWEYAARAGSKRARYGDLDAIAWYAGNSGPRPVDGTRLYEADPKNYEKNLVAKGNHPHKVGQKEANAWQLYDMLGNVWEWTSDWFDKNYYVRSSMRDPAGPAMGTTRALRGGAWDDNARNIRFSNRYSLAPGSRKFYAGFRCVSQ